MGSCGCGDEDSCDDCEGTIRTLKDPSELNYCNSIECSKEECCDNLPFCQDFNFCRDLRGIDSSKENYNIRKCSDSDCSMNIENIQRCCNINPNYETCNSIQEDCINNLRCKKGRKREVFENSSEKCIIDIENNWECDNNTGILCEKGNAICRNGFKEDNGRCIIDKGNNFVCSDINLFEECVGGSAICKPGYVYNNRRCLMNHGTEYDENGRIICREGFIHDRLGNCIFGKIRNGRPTNYILNEDYELSCKDGYKLENGLCKIKDNWTCQRGNSVRGGDDGLFCCDPHEINNVISCRSKPICPEKTRIVQNGECMLFSEVRDKDCIGKWEECDNTCEDSKFTIIQNKSGFGDECRDDEGNILGEGSTRSCLGEYHCNTSNRLCGTNRNNIIIDDFIYI